MRRRTLLAVSVAILAASGGAEGRGQTGRGPVPQATVDVCDAEGDGWSAGSRSGICTVNEQCGMDRGVCSLSARSQLLDVYWAATCMPCQAAASRLNRSGGRPGSDRFEHRADRSALSPLHGAQAVSRGIAGVPGAGGSIAPSLSADGRYVAFDSVASNLVTGDLNGMSDVFVYDRTLGQTERVSVATGGAEGNGDSVAAAITPDGRFVAFLSRSANLVSSDTNGAGDVFVRDRLNGTTA